MLTVLDTHALIWLDQETSDLGVQSRQRVDAALKDGQLAVSAISFWEATMLAAKGRITMALSPSAWRRDLLGLGLVEIPVDGEMGVTAAELDLHGDPADRIIAATASTVLPRTRTPRNSCALPEPSKASPGSMDWNTNVVSGSSGNEFPARHKHDHLPHQRSPGHGAPIWAIRGFGHHGNRVAIVPRSAGNEEQRMRAFLAVADRVAISEPIRDQAITLRRLHRLKIPDAVIAATAVVANAV